MMLLYKGVGVNLSDDRESVIIKNSLSQLFPIAQVQLYDLSRFVSEGLRILGDEVVELGFSDDGVIVRLPFRVSSATIASAGISNLVKLSLVHEYGYKMLMNHLSRGYEDTRIDEIVALELTAAGLLGWDVTQVDTLITVTPTGLNLGQELARIVAYEPRMGFLWHDMIDTAHFKVWEDMKKLAPTAVLSQTGESDTFKLLDWVVEVPNLWLRSAGERIDTFYLDGYDGIAEDTISYTAGQGVGEKNVWLNEFTTKKFLGAGTNPDMTSNRATARFLERIHSTMQMRALVDGSLGWQPGQKVNVVSLGIVDIYDVVTKGEWIVYGVEHTITAQDFKTTLRLTKTGAEQVADGVEGNPV